LFQLLDSGAQVADLTPLKILQPTAVIFLHRRSGGPSQRASDVHLPGLDETAAALLARLSSKIIPLTTHERATIADSLVFAGIDWLGFTRRLFPRLFEV
jgi:hypothetical protein